MPQLYRLHYRGQLDRDYTPPELEKAVKECREQSGISEKKASLPR